MSRTPELVPEIVLIFVCAFSLCNDRRKKYVNDAGKQLLTDKVVLVSKNVMKLALRVTSPDTEREREMLCSCSFCDLEQRSCWSQMTPRDGK